MREVTSEEQRGANSATAYGKESGGGGVGISDTERGPSAALRRRAEQDDEEEDANRSDSDSTVMMSGNSPFVSKSARYNFLQRSGNERMNDYNSTIFILSPPRVLDAWQASATNRHIYSNRTMEHQGF